jgi:hypothetical protein
MREISSEYLIPPELAATIDLANARISWMPIFAM